MKNVVVRGSKVQGKGVFANKDFCKGEVVLEIDDSHIVKDEATLTKHQREFVADYLHDKIVLMKPPERYINHSCDPNTYVKTIGGVRKVLAMREVKKGEEITYDYSVNSCNEGTFKCHCGSKICRGAYQGNFFKLPKEVQLRYLPYLDDWFVEQFKERIEKLKAGK